MITVSNVRHVQIGCKVRLFDVELPNIGFTIRNMSKLTSKGRSWVDYPKGCEENNGEKKFYSYCQFTSEEKSKEFLKIVENELEKVDNQQPDTSTPSSNEVPF